jgi:hypothetical protein
MIGKLPWPALRVPQVPTGTWGDWSVELDSRVKATSGYFRGVRPVQPFPVLRHKKKIWMSPTPQELESQMHIVAGMRGAVVIVGGGMGIAAYNAAMKKDVSAVSVIEVSGEVVALMTRMVESWPKKARGKVSIIHADAFTLPPLASDFLYCDIWELLGDQRAQEDTLKIWKQHPAPVVAWWGQEIDTVTWWGENGYRPPASERDFRAWVASTGMPVFTTERHHYWATAAARQMINPVTVWHDK